MEKVGSLRPDEEYTFLELGNFLTDVSQFRDPYAHMLGKRTVWQTAKAAHWFTEFFSYIPILGPIVTDLTLDATDVDVWLDRLMGVHEPEARRYGDLARYFEKIILALTHVIFSDDIPARQAYQTSLPPSLRIEPIPSSEVDRAYAEFFTQYQPHEHFDFPPYVFHGDQRPYHRKYQRGSRGLINYLEEYLRYLSEELSKLELRWIRAKRRPKDDPERHDILVTFGKLLHGVEDYFFHSNYVELNLWNRLQETRPSSIQEDEFRVWFAANALSGYARYQGYEGYGQAGPDPTQRSGSATAWRRRLMRRLRYPMYSSGNNLDTDVSASSLDLIYTGGFESNDLYHTIAGALESFEDILVGIDDAVAQAPPGLAQGLGIPSTGGLRNSSLVLVKTVFNEAERTHLSQDEDYQKERVALHAVQLKSGVYETGISGLKSAGYLNDSAEKALRDAIKIDKSLEAFDQRTPGVGGFMVQFLAQAQGAINESRRRSQRLDARDAGQPEAGAVLDMSTDNRASGELIGTHTLMSKDATKNQPLHEDAVVLARYASLAVVHLMLTSVNGSGGETVGQDWDRILRHLVRYPRASAAMWETQALNHYRRQNLHPGFADLPGRPHFPQIRAADPDGRLRLRRAGTQQITLEKMYTDLEERADEYMVFNLIPG